ncbi:MAG TPA: M28 family peptidase [Bryobacteraceae bacterium]|nr:M28 family peptidase [Bryobacteraceae bacterium]
MPLRFVLALALTAGVLYPQNQHLSGDRIRAHIKYLASDELEGRGVGTRGEKLATDYLAAQLELTGLQPAGDNGTYFQQVPMVGATTLPSASINLVSGKHKTALVLGKDFVGTALSQQTDNKFDAEAIFVGHGISAPEFGWDDFKGVDLRGKVLVFVTNEPPSDDQNFFAGRALTYYGRWTYKFEQAARQGAVAAIIVHTTATAGYGWPVVAGSWGHENVQLKLAPGENGLSFAGWATEEAGAKLFAATGKTVDQMLALANQKDFAPIDLGIRISAHIPVELRQIESRNVLGRVPGAGPELRSQVVLYSAHWDHLGIGVPVRGDNIYNGALDNASGCAVLLEIARIWAALPTKPERSVVFLFVTAEEAGLLGSQYYGEHPEAPAGQTAADLNFDMLSPFGPTRDIGLTGAERTTLWPLVQRDAARMQLDIAPDPVPEQGHYYRSDHFSLARIGVPSFSISPGTNYVGKPAGFGQAAWEDFNANRYHQPSDEYHQEWDVSGMVQLAQFGLNLGLDIANTPKLPSWKSGDEFLPARQKSGVQ